MMRNPPREVSGSGADVGDNFVRAQLQSRDHFMGLLPCIARGVLEVLRILSCRARRVMLVRCLRCGCGGTDCYQSENPHDYSVSISVSQ
jgi:hypothetical protein